MSIEENRIDSSKPLGNNTEQNVNFNPYDARNFKPIKQEVEEEERTVGDVVGSYVAGLSKGVVSIVDQVVKGYETGEFGVLGELAGEGILEVPLGYIAEEARKRGYEVPKEYLWLDLTSPAERRAVYEEHMLKMAKDPEMSLQVAQTLDPTNKIKFEKAISWLDEHVYQHTDEQGKPMDYLALTSEAESVGDYAKAADAFLNDAFGAIPSLIISRLPYGTGAALLGASAYMENFERELFNRGNKEGVTREDIVKNSIITGGSDMVMEFIGGGIINKLAGAGVSKPVMKKMLVGLPRYMAGKAGLGYISEFVTEGLTGVMQDAADAYTFGDQKSISNYFRTFFKDGFLGGFLGAGAVLTSTPQKKEIYQYVAPQEFKQEQLKIEQDIITYETDKAKASDADKVIIDKKIKELKDKKQKNNDRLFNYFESLTKKQKAEYAGNLDLIHEQLDIIGNKAFSKKSQEDASETLKNLTERNNKFFKGTDINYSADLEAAIGRTLKASERIQEQKGFFGFNKSNLNVKYLDSDKQVAEVEAEFPGFKAADGMFYAEDASGKPTIYINSKVASATGQTNVIGHEYLHAITSQAFKGAIGRANLKSSVSEFVKYLNDTGQESLVADIEARLATQYDALDSSGDIIRDASGLVKTKNEANQEEYFNIFSDIIKTEKLEAVESKSGGLKNSFRQLYVGLGFSSVDFQNGQDVFDFLVDYNTNINRNSILGKITSKRIAKTKMKGLEAKTDKRFKGGTDAFVGDGKKSLTDRSGDVNEIANMGWTNKTWEQGGGDYALKIMQEEKMLDALIYSKYKADKVPSKFVELVYSELTSHVKRFKPENNTDFFAYVNSQIENKAGNVYNRDFKQDEAMKGAKNLDDRTKEGAPVVQIAAEEKTSSFETENVLANQVREKRGEKKSEVAVLKEDRVRKLKSLADVNLENSEVVSSTVRTEIENLIKESPKNLEQKITSLIEKNITKVVKEQMGKIENKKGEVVVSDNYKAFLALNYTNIVQSLDVNTIKNNYKTLFELTQIGKEDTKTKREGKKDSNLHYFVG